GKTSRIKLPSYRGPTAAKACRSGRRQPKYMAMAPRHSSFVSRRGVLAGGAALVAGPAWAARPKRIAMLGDSITAGYGLSPAQALPARLKAELARLGWAVEVLAAGRNGDTTGGGAARVDRATP